MYKQGITYVKILLTPVSDIVDLVQLLFTLIL